MAESYLAQNIILPLHVDPAGGSVQPAVFAFGAGLFPLGEIPTTWAATFDIVAQANQDATRSIVVYGTLQRASNGAITVGYEAFPGASSAFNVTLTGGTDQVTATFAMGASFTTADVSATFRIRFLWASET